MADDDKKPPEVDEKYLLQWFEYGLSELDGYMARAARFDAWCKRHHREETREQDDSE